MSQADSRQITAATAVELEGFEPLAWAWLKLSSLLASAELVLSSPQLFMMHLM